MAEHVKALSDDLTALVETTERAVVRVDARRRLSASGTVWSADGVVVAAAHTVQRAENVTIGTPDGETAAARLAGVDATTDIAVLRTDAPGLVAATWREPANARVGELVLALGRPEGWVEASLGVLSASGGEWRTRAGGRIDTMLRADLVMYPGFSGGPLVDADAQVLGVMSSAFRAGNLAIPAATVRRVVNAILTHGAVRRAYLGVGVQPARLPEGLAKDLGQETGLLVTSVEPGTGADAAGIILGDVIAGIDGRRVLGSDDLFAALTEVDAGATVTLRIVRGGEVREVEAATGERPEPRDE